LFYPFRNHFLKGVWNVNRRPTPPFQYKKIC
jgi:hypothetical protein